MVHCLEWDLLRPIESFPYSRGALALLGPAGDLVASLLCGWEDGTAAPLMYSEAESVITRKCSGENQLMADILLYLSMVNCTVVFLLKKL